MNQYMTAKEIEETFDSEWVLVVDPQTDDALEILGGWVRCHSKDRDEVYREALRLKPDDSAVLYTGKMPEGTAMAL